jgi:hypothetical protein
LSSVPVTHTLPAQHPAQFDGPHTAGTHVAFLHVSPKLAHVWQSAPPLPHALSCVPIAHTPLMQHPAQLCASHVSFDSQNPPLGPKLAHVCPGPHDKHAKPLLPHALVDVPGTHALP